MLGLTRHGAEQLTPGFFEGSHARLASADSDVWEPAFQFTGFVDISPRETVIYVQLENHPYTESAVLHLYNQHADRSATAVLTAIGGDAARSVHY